VQTTLNRTGEIQPLPEWEKMFEKRKDVVDGI
jgi:hypothetical protein